MAKALGIFPRSPPRKTNIFTFTFCPPATWAGEAAGDEAAGDEAAADAEAEALAEADGLVDAEELDEAA
ncbi:MAG: hypothetical protein ACYDAG_10695, partial [Chloroflexota bacterium]